MDGLEKEKRLYDELASLFERFTREYDMTYPQILGVIELIKAELIEQNKSSA